MIQLGGFLGELLGSWLKTRLSLMKNIIKLLAKIILSAQDAGIHKKIMGSGTTTLTESNGEMEDIMKIIKSLEDSGLLLNGGSEIIQNEFREHKGRF